MTYLRAAAAGLAALSALTVAAPGGAASAPDDETKILIISLPALTWPDVKNHDLPNIEAFLDEAALADLAPRGVSHVPTAGAAYLTISAGARATSDPLVDGQQLSIDEKSAGSTAGEIFQRRTGEEPDGEFVSLPWPTLVASNEAQPYGTDPGLLADTLRDAGFGAAAIGNADGTDSVGRSFERQVGLAVAQGNGVLSGGELGDDLVVAEAGRPFGLTLDQDVVLARFRDAWDAPAGRPGGAVFVEASDLARTMRYHDLVSGQRYAELLDEALADADQLVGRLLAEIDPEHDAVLLVAPYNLPPERDLTVVALRSPEVDAGYLQSASTQRSGFVTLVDIAPTVLDLLGLDRPVAMEGRPAETVGSSATVEERVDRLVTLRDESRFRRHLLFPTSLAVIIALAAVCAGAAVLIARDHAISRAGEPPNSSADGTRAHGLVSYAAMVVLAALPMSYLVRLFPVDRLGLGFYWAFLLIGSFVLAGLAVGVSRWLRHPRLAVVGLLVVVLVVPLADVMTGSNLSLGAAFGYSATDNSRLYGISNYAFGQAAAASCLLAGMMVSGRASRSRRLAAIGLLVATLVVIGAPVWGSDVGGTLAFAPTILVFAALAYQQRINARMLGFGAAVSLLAVTFFGLLDLARPAGERAHLGRLFERVGNEGVDPLIDIVERKALAMVGVTTSSFWIAGVLVGVAFLVFLSRFPSRPLARLQERMPGLNTGLVAAYVAAVLGTLVNDSGVIIAGLALTVLAASLAVLALERPTRPPREEAPSRAVAAEVEHAG